MSNASSTHSLTSIGSSRIRSAKEYVYAVEIVSFLFNLIFRLGLRQDKLGQKRMVRNRF
jgi:hypothetical protein